MRPLEIAVGLPDGGGTAWVEAVASQTAELMQRKVVPELRGETPKLTGALRRGWKVVARENHVLLINSQFYVHLANRHKGTPERYDEIFKRHAYAMVRQAAEDVGWPAVRDHIADAAADMARRTPGVTFRRPFR